MREAITYYAGQHTMRKKDIGGHQHSWPVKDSSRNTKDKNPVVEASWVPMSEIEKRRLVNPGRIKVMKKYWEQLDGDVRLFGKAQKDDIEAEMEDEVIEPGTSNPDASDTAPEPSDTTQEPTP